MVTDYKELENRARAMGHADDVVLAFVSAMVSIDKYDLSEGQKHDLYSLLSQAGFEALESLPEAVAKGQWVDFDYGNVKLGDYVRVKEDAYTSPSGVNHNGKVGRLVNAYGGKAQIDYLGLDTGRGMPHPFSSLESLKRV